MNKRLDNFCFVARLPNRPFDFELAAKYFLNIN